MKLFREYYSFKWWQVGLFKVYLFVGGIVIGAYFADYIRNYYTPLIAVFVALMVYFLYAYFGDKI